MHIHSIHHIFNSTDTRAPRNGAEPLLRRARAESAERHLFRPKAELFGLDRTATLTF